MTSFPHNLILDSQTRFGLSLSQFLNIYNFLINKQIIIKIAAKCSVFVSFSYQVHVKIYNLIPLNWLLPFGQIEGQIKIMKNFGSNCSKLTTLLVRHGH